MVQVEVPMPLYEFRISLTGRCNHKCLYCGPFSDGKGNRGYGEFSMEQVKKLTPLLRNKGLHVQLTGGEPTLRKDLGDIIKILRKGGVEDIGITTNGSKMDPRYAQRIIDEGILDMHIHMPSLDPDIFRQTTGDGKKGVVDRIKQTAFYLKEQGKGIEFNTPVTPINLRTISQLTDFCYLNKINLKLIEEVSLGEEHVTEMQIIKTLEDWFQCKGLDLDESKVNKKYGRIYDLGDFSFRVAPATKGLANFLKGHQERILYDGRYWIGGREGKWVFTPSCFLETQIGTFEDLEKNLNETMQIYNKHEKE